MQRYVMTNDKNSYVEDFQARDLVIEKLKNRFKTYGYKQVRTQTFESYDLYSAIAGTVPKNEMIKVIDPTGEVLVLRPDVTIPITRMAALNGKDAAMNQRLFYVLDVFRQSEEQNSGKERTQAGVELFGEDSPEMDAEIIALAVHTMKDLGFANFTIEIGHAGFFKTLIEQAELSAENLETLQALIQSKNLIEIDPFLTKLDMDKGLKKAIQSIPLLYGKPGEVIQQANDIANNEQMKEILNNLQDVLDLLHAYGVENHVVFNFGLINNMNYYSGIIFQGFVDGIGKPVFMGGRYDHLGEQFASYMPAIGFAVEVDLVVHALNQQGLLPKQDATVDLLLRYESELQKEALPLACKLRDQGFEVLTYRMETERPETIAAKREIVFAKDKKELKEETTSYAFAEINDLLARLQQKRRENNWNL